VAAVAPSPPRLLSPAAAAAPAAAPAAGAAPRPGPRWAPGLLGRGWRYRSTDRRDLRLDFLRGYCAFAMVVDHLGGASYFYPVTGGNTFFVSAAEGFIFLSGLLVGLIYGPRVLREGLARVQLHLLKRAFTLYAVTLGLTFTFIGLSRLTDMPWMPEAEPLTAELGVSILTLHRTYYLVDVMLLYTLLLAVSPLAILLLTSGRWWVLALLSGGLWLAHQWFPAQSEVPWPVINNPTFPFSAWQMWFVSGMVIGYFKDQIWARLAAVPRWPALLALGGAAAVLVWLRYTNGDALAGVGGTADGTAALNLIFEKVDARWGRIVAGLVFFPLFYGLLTYAWGPLSRLTGWLFVPFGQNALYVYSVHLFAVYACALFLPLVGGFDRLTPWMNTPVQIVALLGLLWMVKRRVLFEVIPR
jgi:hypothetical protein